MSEKQPPKPLTAPSPEVAQRRHDELSNKGLYGYTPSSIRHETEPKRSETQAISDLLVSEEGFAIARAITRHLPGRNNTRPVEQKGKFYSHQLSENLRSAVFLKHLSPETLRAFLDLQIAVSGEQRYALEPLLRIFINSPYLANDFTPEKLADGKKLFKEFQKLATRDKSHLFRPILLAYTEAMAGTDLSSKTAASFCQSIDRMYKKPATKELVRSLVPTLIETRIFPDQHPIHELQSFTEGLIAVAYKDPTAIPSTNLSVITSLINTRAPGIIDGFTLEKAKIICGQIAAAGKGERPGDYREYLGNALYTMLRVTKIQDLTLDSWPALIPKAKEISEVSGKGANEVLNALPNLARLYDLEKDWPALIEFLEKEVRGSAVQAKSLRTLKTMGPIEKQMLEFVARNKRKSFIGTLDTLALANTFGLRLRSQDAALVSPLPVTSLEDVDALFTSEQDKRGTPDSSIAERFERAYRHLRESNIDADPAKSAEKKDEDKQKIDTAKLRKLFERVQTARARKDLVACQKLLTDASVLMGNEAYPYFERRLHAGIVAIAKKEFGLATFDEERLRNPAFISAYSILKGMQKNEYSHDQDDVANAKEVLYRYLAGAENVISTHPRNVAWLGKLGAERAQRWMSDNRREYDLAGAPLSSNTASRLRHFSAEARRLFDEMGVRVAADADGDALIEAFRNIPAAAPGSKEAHLYADLKTQIGGIRQALRGSVGGYMPKKLVMYKETDPMRVLMMGTWVSGSCLDAEGGNAWSTFVNASEANKAVFWITDERERILGRVLVAMDKNQKLVRFPMYYPGYGLDLDPQFNAYLREVAKELKVGVNGDRNKVEKLIAHDWYMDSDTPRV